VNPHLMYIWCNIYLFIYLQTQTAQPGGRCGIRLTALSYFSASEPLPAFATAVGLLVRSARSTSLATACPMNECAERTQ
jgi:hypothetical protein